jgi:RNA polymerase sigma-70 factor (family 1)
LDNLPTYNDKELFALIADGDEAAFEQLFNRYLPKLTTYTLRLTKDQEVAKEIVQETFVQLWLGRDKLEVVENPGGWIFTITAKQSYKYLRRSMIKENMSLAIDLLEEAPIDHIGLNELKGLVQNAVLSLSDQRKKIFLLSRDQGMTIPEIAETLQLSNSTVKNTLVSALKQIREHLQARGYLLPTILILLFTKN